ncbi:MAG: hypothetical protein K6E95_03675 [Lachnospiraceae bacterium]|nr:hypothetical protein [Lachnospiraceae bacterium]
MRIEAGDNKKTVLPDNSAIYSKREKRTDRETFKSLDRKGKWQYFKDYILKKLLVSIAVVAILIYAFVTIFGPKVMPVYYAAVFSNPFTERDMDQFRGGFRDLVINDPDLEDVYFDTAFSFDESDSAGRYKFAALLAAAEIDALICPMAELRTDVNSEAIWDLREILPEELYKRVEDKLVWLEPEVYDPDYDKTVIMPSAPYAVDISDFVKKYSSYDVRLNYYYSVVINGTHKDNAVKFIEYMMDLLEGKTSAVGNYS